LLSIGDMKAVSFEGKEGLAVGTLPRYNHFGSYMAFCFLAAFLLWWFGALNKKYWYVWGSLILLFAAGLIMSSSGIPVVGTFCCVLMHILTNAKVRPRLSILVFGLLVGAIILVLIMRGIVDPFAFAGGEQGPLNRLFSLFGYERWDRDTQYGRVYMHRTVIPVILQSCPAFGLGLGTVGSPVTGTSAGYENAIFPRYYRADELGVPYIMRNECPLPHYISDSGWLSLFAQTGIVGIALYGLILVQAGWYLWRIHRVTGRQEDRVSAGWSAAAFYGFLLFVICGFVTAGYIHRYYLQMCCFFCAMSMTATPRNPPPNPVDSLKPVDFGEPSEK
jgi:4-amino-4-deoxy-L-arabinose transferase-like glycosyltransferase